MEAPLSEFMPVDKEDDASFKSWEKEWKQSNNNSLVEFQVSVSLKSPCATSSDPPEGVNSDMKTSHTSSSTKRDAEPKQKRCLVDDKPLTLSDAHEILSEKQIRDAKSAFSSFSPKPLRCARVGTVLRKVKPEFTMEEVKQAIKQMNLHISDEVTETQLLILFATLEKVKEKANEKPEASKDTAASKTTKPTDTTITKSTKPTETRTTESISSSVKTRASEVSTKDSGGSATKTGKDFRSTEPTLSSDWKEEKWAKQLGDEYLENIEEVFKTYAVVENKEFVLPLKRLPNAFKKLRIGINSVDFREWRGLTGMHMDDTLTVAEFGHTVDYFISLRRVYSTSSFGDNVKSAASPKRGMETAPRASSVAKNTQVVDREPSESTASRATQLLYQHGPEWKEDVSGKGVDELVEPVYDGLMKHQTILNRLSAGKSRKQIDALMKVESEWRSLSKESAKVYLSWTDEEREQSSYSPGQVLCSKLPELLKKMGRKEPNERDEYSLTMLREEKASKLRCNFDELNSAFVSFLEFLGVFGYIVDEADLREGLTVEIACNYITLHEGSNVGRLAIETMLGYLFRTLDSPQRSSQWEIMAEDVTFVNQLEGIQGGSLLLEACHFAHFVRGQYSFYGPRTCFNERGEPKGALDDSDFVLLRAARFSCERQLKVLDEGCPPISHAVRVAYNRSQQMQGNNSANSIITALNLLSKYVDNVLRDPYDWRRWKIPESNPVLKERLYGFGFDVVEVLMNSIGFFSRLLEETTGQVCFVLKGTSFDLGDQVISQFEFPTVPEATLQFLWRRKISLAKEKGRIQQLIHGEYVDMQAEQETAENSTMKKGSEEKSPKTATQSGGARASRQRSKQKTTKEPEQSKPSEKRDAASLLFTALNCVSISSPHLSELYNRPVSTCNKPEESSDKSKQKRGQKSGVEKDQPSSSTRNAKPITELGEAFKSVSSSSSTSKFFYNILLKQANMIKLGFERKSQQCGISSAQLSTILRDAGFYNDPKSVEFWKSKLDVDKDGIVSLFDFISAVYRVFVYPLSPELSTGNDTASLNKALLQCLNEGLVVFGIGIVSAIGLSRLLMFPRPHSRVLNTLADALDEIIEFPNDKSKWQITYKSEQESSGITRSALDKLGKLEQALKTFRNPSVGLLLRSCGFIPSSAAGPYLYLWGSQSNDWSKIPSYVIEHLKQCRDLCRMHALITLIPEAPDTAAVAAAILYLRYSFVVEENETPPNFEEKWYDAFQSFMTCLEHIIANPSEPVYRRINLRNQNFERKLKTLPGPLHHSLWPYNQPVVIAESSSGANDDRGDHGSTVAGWPGFLLFNSVGFVEADSSTLVLPHTADLQILNARKHELELFRFFLPNQKGRVHEQEPKATDMQTVEHEHIISRNDELSAVSNQQQLLQLLSESERKTKEQREKIEYLERDINKLRGKLDRRLPESYESMVMSAEPRQRNNLKRLMTAVGYEMSSGEETAKSGKRSKGSGGVTVAERDEGDPRMVVEGLTGSRFITLSTLEIPTQRRQESRAKSKKGKKLAQTESPQDETDTDRRVKVGSCIKISHPEDANIKEVVYVVGVNESTYTVTLETPLNVDLPVDAKVVQLLQSEEEKRKFEKRYVGNSIHSLVLGIAINAMDESTKLRKTEIEERSRGSCRLSLTPVYRVCKLSWPKAEKAPVVFLSAAGDVTMVGANVDNVEVNLLEEPLHETIVALPLFFRLFEYLNHDLNESVSFPKFLNRLQVALKNDRESKIISMVRIAIYENAPLIGNPSYRFGDVYRSLVEALGQHRSPETGDEANHLSRWLSEKPRVLASRIAFHFRSPHPLDNILEQKSFGNVVRTHSVVEHVRKVTPEDVDQLLPHCDAASLEILLECAIEVELVIADEYFVPYGQTSQWLQQDNDRGIVSPTSWCWEALHLLILWADGGNIDGIEQLKATWGSREESYLFSSITEQCSPPLLLLVLRQLFYSVWRSDRSSESSYGGASVHRNIRFLANIFKENEDDCGFIDCVNLVNTLNGNSVGKSLLHSRNGLFLRQLENRHGQQLSWEALSGAFLNAIYTPSLISMKRFSSKRNQFIPRYVPTLFPVRHDVDFHVCDTSRGKVIITCDRYGKVTTLQQSTMQILWERDLQQEQSSQYCITCDSVKTYNSFLLETQNIVIVKKSGTQDIWILNGFTGEVKYTSRIPKHDDDFDDGTVDEIAFAERNHQLLALDRSRHRMKIHNCLSNETEVLNSVDTTTFTFIDDLDCIVYGRTHVCLHSFQSEVNPKVLCAIDPELISITHTKIRSAHILLVSNGTDLIVMKLIRDGLKGTINCETLKHVTCVNGVDALYLSDQPPPHIPNGDASDLCFHQEELGQLIEGSWKHIDQYKSLHVGLVYQFGDGTLKTVDFAVIQGKHTHELNEFISPGILQLLYGDIHQEVASLMERFPRSISAAALNDLLCIACNASQCVASMLIFSWYAPISMLQRYLMEDIKFRLNGTSFQEVRSVFDVETNVIAQVFSAAINGMVEPEERFDSNCYVMKIPLNKCDFAINKALDTESSLSSRGQQITTSCEGDKASYFTVTAVGKEGSESFVIGVYESICPLNKSPRSSNFLHTALKKELQRSLFFWCNQWRRQRQLLNEAACKVVSKVEKTSLSQYDSLVTFLLWLAPKTRTSFVHHLPDVERCSKSAKSFLSQIGHLSKDLTAGNHQKECFTASIWDVFSLCLALRSPDSPCSQATSFSVNSQIMALSETPTLVSNGVDLSQKQLERVCSILSLSNPRGRAADVVKRCNGLMVQLKNGLRDDGAGLSPLVCYCIHRAALRMEESQHDTSADNILASSGLLQQLDVVINNVVLPDELMGECLDTCVREVSEFCGMLFKYVDEIVFSSDTRDNSSGSTRSTEKDLNMSVFEYAVNRSAMEVASLSCVRLIENYSSRNEAPPSPVATAVREILCLPDRILSSSSSVGAMSSSLKRDFVKSVTASNLIALGCPYPLSSYRARVNVKGLVEDTAKRTFDIEALAGVQKFLADDNSEEDSLVSVGANVDGDPKKVMNDILFPFSFSSCIHVAHDENKATIDTVSKWGLDRLCHLTLEKLPLMMEATAKVHSTWGIERKECVHSSPFSTGKDALEYVNQVSTTLLNLSKGLSNDDIRNSSKYLILIGQFSALIEDSNVFTALMTALNCSERSVRATAVSALQRILTSLSKVYPVANFFGENGVRVRGYADRLFNVASDTGCLSILCGRVRVAVRNQTSQSARGVSRASNHSSAQVQEFDTKECLIDIAAIMTSLFKSGFCNLSTLRLLGVSNLVYHVLSSPQFPSAATDEFIGFLSWLQKNPQYSEMYSHFCSNKDIISWSQRARLKFSSNTLLAEGSGLAAAAEFLNIVYSSGISQVLRMETPEIKTVEKTSESYEIAIGKDETEDTYERNQLTSDTWCALLNNSSFGLGLDDSAKDAVPYLKKLYDSWRVWLFGDLTSWVDSLVQKIHMEVVNGRISVSPRTRTDRLTVSRCVRLLGVCWWAVLLSIRLSLNTSPGSGVNIESLKVVDLWMTFLQRIVQRDRRYAVVLLLLPIVTKGRLVVASLDRRQTDENESDYLLQLIPLPKFSPWLVVLNNFLLYRMEDNSHSGSLLMHSQSAVLQILSDLFFYVSEDMDIESPENEKVNLPNQLLCGLLAEACMATLSPSAAICQFVWSCDEIIAAVNGTNPESLVTTSLPQNFEARSRFMCSIARLTYLYLITKEPVGHWIFSRTSMRNFLRDAYSNKVFEPLISKSQHTDMLVTDFALTPANFLPFNRKYQVRLEAISLLWSLAEPVLGISPSNVSDNEIFETIKNCLISNFKASSIITHERTLVWKNADRQLQASCLALLNLVLCVADESLLAEAISHNLDLSLSLFRRSGSTEHVLELWTSWIKTVRKRKPDRTFSEHCSILTREQPSRDSSERRKLLKSETGEFSTAKGRSLTVTLLASQEIHIPDDFVASLLCYCEDSDTKPSQVQVIPQETEESKDSIVRIRIPILAAIRFHRKLRIQDSDLISLLRHCGAETVKFSGFAENEFTVPYNTNEDGGKSSHVEEETYPDIEPLEYAPPTAGSNLTTQSLSLEQVDEVMNRLGDNITVVKDIFDEFSGGNERMYVKDVHDALYRIGVPKKVSLACLKHLDTGKYLSFHQFLIAAGKCLDTVHDFGSKPRPAPEAPTNKHVQPSHGLLSAQDIQRYKGKIEAYLNSEASKLSSRIDDFIAEAKAEGTGSGKSSIKFDDLCHLMQVWDSHGSSRDAGRRQGRQFFRYFGRLLSETINSEELEFCLAAWLWHQGDQR